MAAQTLKDLAIGFLTQVVTGDVAGAFDRYVGNDFCHHNPHFHDDAVSLQAAMEEDELKNPGKTLDIHVAIQDGSYVAVHSRLRHADHGLEIAVVHLFRFENQRIAELWDIVQVAPERIVNPNGMF